jgi:rare lipoprotein A
VKSLATLALAASLSACGHFQQPATWEPEEGEASFYAAELEGRRTASGEIYRGDKLSCAHPSYPFGTHLKITNLENDKTVIVVVNDRGPFSRWRVVDLSYAAARELEMVGKGKVRVRVEALK